MSLSLVADNLPSGSLSYTNAVYVNAGDFGKYFSKSSIVLVGELPYTVCPHEGVAPNCIGLSAFQREAGRIGMREPVKVSPIAEQLAALPLAAQVSLQVELARPVKGAPPVEIDGESLEKSIKARFGKQILSKGHILVIDYEARPLRISVEGVVGVPLAGKGAGAAGIGSAGPSGSTSSSGVSFFSASAGRGLLGAVLTEHTDVEATAGDSGSVRVNTSKMVHRSIFKTGFNFEDLGIGGLSKEFGDIFRRAFASRVFPGKVVADLGISHVKGMVLHGPPGTGKTLIARQISKILRAHEPKIVNGPEILNKYVGQSEANIRELFADAEKEYKKSGNESQLHIIILDELDAICKQRGSTREGTGVHDSVVNQLLSKIDGVDALNNILIIGMTNRLDMIDEALLRPGRLEVHVEISLPNEAGRLEIFKIHTKQMSAKKYLAPDVNLEHLAKRALNFSGAEIAGLVRSAASYAFARHVSFPGAAPSGGAGAPGIASPSAPTTFPTSAGPKGSEIDLKITMEDFECAFGDVRPAFGHSGEELERRVRYGLIKFSEKMVQTVEEVERLAKLVSETSITKGRKSSDLVSILLTGDEGSGKTALACSVARNLGFPFTRVISPDNLIGYSEGGKIGLLTKVFDDAYKTASSCVILDDIERLCEFVSIGPRFSNGVLQALMVLLKKQAPKDGRRLLVICTSSSSSMEFFRATGLSLIFARTVELPEVESESECEKVLSACFPTACSDPSTFGELCRLTWGSSMHPVPVKHLISNAETFLSSYQ